MRAAAEAATVIGVIVALCTQARLRTRIQEWAVVRYVYRWTRFQNAASGIHPDNSRRNRLTRSMLGWLVPRSYRPGGEIPDDKRISLDNEIEYRLPWFNLHALKNNPRLYDRIKDYSDVKETPRWVKELRECHRGVVCADCGTDYGEPSKTEEIGRNRERSLLRGRIRLVLPESRVRRWVRRRVRQWFGGRDDRLSGWKCPEGSVCMAEGAESDHYCRSCRTRREYQELGAQFPS